MKNKIIIGLIPFILLPSFIFGGFAFFYFGNQYVINNDQGVDIDIEDNPSLGTVKLIYKEINATGSETYKDELYGGTSSLKNQLFMDFDNVYFIRNDNLTIEREFIVDYIPPEDNFASISTKYNVGLFCDINIIDIDARGYKINKFKDSETNEERSYVSSNSIIDYFEPSYITYKDLSRNMRFEINNDDETATNVTYTCLMYSDIRSIESERYASFYLENAYSNYSFSEDDEIFEGNMAPSSSTTKEIYQKKLEATMSAKQNSKINIIFRLGLIEAN